MTRDEMLKTCWRPYQEVNYQHPRTNEPILCLLVEIDFDEESMTLQPLFGEGYINKDFIANISHCSIPKKRMKAVVIEGKKVKEGLPIYEGSMGRKNPYLKLGNDLEDAS